jgi:serpin B
MKIFLIFLALLIAAMPAVCGEPGDVPSVANGINALAFDLYGKLRSEDGNLFLSPYSISTALAMTWAGARGATEQEMAKTLHFDLGQDQLHPACGQLIERLNAAGKAGDFELDVANRLWGQSDYKILTDFQKTVKTFYGADIAPADFQKNAEGARKEINGWVEKKTKDKIKDLLQPGVLQPLTRLVLVNAIYFKGAWTTAFDKKATTTRPFTLENGKKVNVPMMRQVKDFAYAEDETVQVLELPYKGNELSMIVLLPRTVDGRKALEEKLTVENLNRWTGAASHKRVDVQLPRFKSTSQFELSNTLNELGMKDAFSPQADFSGMTGNRYLFISAIIHKAFVDVNEKGTEAAAATAVTMREACAPPKEPPVEFRADHPFVFLIRDNPSNAILFLGRVMNPGS